MNLNLDVLCEVDGCERPRPRFKLMCRMHGARVERHGDPHITHRGEWQTDTPSYFGMHYRVKARRGSASLQMCVACKEPAREWAWIHGANRYDIEGYQAMCVRCHRRYDAEGKKA